MVVKGKSKEHLEVFGDQRPEMRWFRGQSGEPW